MKNIAIIYATREGQTRKVTEQMALYLREQGVSVVVHNAKDLWTRNLRSFDVLVFGGSVHAGAVEKELIHFIQQHQAEICPNNSALFLVLLSAATKDATLKEQSLDAARKMVTRQMPVPFARIEMIAGALKYTQYSLPIRWVMKRISKKAGGDTDTSRDYEYTDWNQVKRFAADLARASAAG